MVWTLSAVIFFKLISCSYCDFKVIVSDSEIDSADFI